MLRLSRVVLACCGVCGSLLVPGTGSVGDSCRGEAPEGRPEAEGFTCSEPGSAAEMYFKKTGCTRYSHTVTSHYSRPQSITEKGVEQTIHDKYAC